MAEASSAPAPAPIQHTICNVLLVDCFDESCLDLGRLMARKRYHLRLAGDLAEVCDALNAEHHCAAAVSRDIGQEEFNKVIDELRANHAQMPIVVFTRHDWGEEELEFAAAQIGEAQPAALFAVLDCLVQEIEEGLV